MRSWHHRSPYASARSGATSASVSAAATSSGDASPPQTSRSRRSLAASLSPLRGARADPHHPLHAAANAIAAADGGFDSGTESGDAGGGGGGGPSAVLSTAVGPSVRVRFTGGGAASANAHGGVAQIRERWWREAVVRVDAVLRRRYKLNGVNMVAAMENPAAPDIEFFAARLAEIAANPDKAEALLAAAGPPGT